MLYFHLSRGSSQQNFDFFSLNYVTANLPIETGHKIIQEAEFKFHSQEVVALVKQTIVTHQT